MNRPTRNGSIRTSALLQSFFTTSAPSFLFRLTAIDILPRPKRSRDGCITWYNKRQTIYNMYRNMLILKWLQSLKSVYMKITLAVKISHALFVLSQQLCWEVCNALIPSLSNNLKNWKSQITFGRGVPVWQCNDWVSRSQASASDNTQDNLTMISW